MISPQLRNSRMKRQHTDKLLAKPLQLGLPLPFHSGGDRTTIDMWQRAMLRAMNRNRTRPPQ